MAWVTALTASFGAVLYALAYLASWCYGLFSVLASPMWILAHAILYVLLSPLRLLIKFEVRMDRFSILSSRYWSQPKE